MTQEMQVPVKKYPGPDAENDDDVYVGLHVRKNQRMLTGAERPLVAISESDN